MLTPGRKYVGSAVRVLVHYQDDTGTDLTPSTVSLKVLPPGRKGSDPIAYTYADGQVLLAATGQYYFDIIPDTPGRWWYAWEGVGGDLNTTLIERGSFTVQSTPFDSRKHVYEPGERW